MRLLVSPGRVEAFLMGRVLSLALVLLLAVTGGLLIARPVMGIPARIAVTAVVFTVLSGSALYLVLQLLVAYAGTARTANVVSNLVLLPLAMLGGSFFPFELMPPWLAAIGRFTPNGWSVLQLSGILAGRSGAVEIGLACAGVVVVGSVAFALVARRLRRSFGV